MLQPWDYTVPLTQKRRPFKPHLQNPLTATSANVSDTTEYSFPISLSSTDACNSRFVVTALNHIRTKVEQIKKKWRKREGEVVSVHSMKTYRGSTVIAPFIPNIHTRRSCQLHCPAVLSRYPLNRRLGGFQGWSGEKISCHYRYSNPWPSSHCTGYSLSQLWILLTSK